MALRTTCDTIGHDLRDAELIQFPDGRRWGQHKGDKCKECRDLIWNALELLKDQAADLYNFGGNTEN